MVIYFFVDSTKFFYHVKVVNQKALTDLSSWYLYKTECYKKKICIYNKKPR